MAQTQILPGHTYIHVSSKLSPSELSTAFAAAPAGAKLEYRGPVGELDNEYVFEVVGADNDATLPPDGELWKRDGDHVLRSVRAAEGVASAQVLVPKQRAKRDEF